MTTNRDTAYLLLPPSMEDWRPKGRLARFVVDTVDQLELPELREGLSISRETIAARRTLVSRFAGSLNDYRVVCGGA